MKKIFLAVALLASVGLLAGCQSKSGGFDNADSAAFENANTTTDDIGNPPVPPDPSSEVTQ